MIKREIRNQTETIGLYLSDNRQERILCVLKQPLDRRQSRFIATTASMAVAGRDLADIKRPSMSTARRHIKAVIAT